MFEFGRDLRRRLTADKPSAVTRDGLTRGDTALLELLDLDLLQAEAKAADVAAGRISVSDAPAARLTASGVWREVARRTGDPVALRRAAAHAQAALEGFEKAHRGADAARARCAQAACGLLGAELFADDGLNAAAAIALKAAAAQNGVGAALAQAMLAGIEARRVLAKGDAADAVAAALAFEAPIAALLAAGRRSSQARLAAADHRLVRAEMLAGCATRLHDRDLAVEALAQLKTVIQNLDSSYEPLLWARAQGLRGVALAALGEMEGDVGLVADGVEALADARPTVRAARRPPANTGFAPEDHTMTTSTRWTAALVVLAATVAVLATIALLATAPALAAGPVAAVDPGVLRWGYVSAAASAGLAALGAGYAVAQVGTAALGALAEKPELFGRVLVLVGLAEGIAIYGLIVSILILNRLG